MFGVSIVLASMVLGAVIGNRRKIGSFKAMLLNLFLPIVGLLLTATSTKKPEYKDRTILGDLQKSLAPAMAKGAKAANGIWQKVSPVLGIAAGMGIAAARPVARAVAKPIRAVGKRISALTAPAVGAVSKASSSIGNRIGIALSPIVNGVSKVTAPIAGFFTNWYDKGKEIRDSWNKTDDKKKDEAEKAEKEKSADKDKDKEKSEAEDFDENEMYEAMEGGVTIDVDGSDDKSKDKEKAADKSQEKEIKETASQTVKEEEKKVETQNASQTVHPKPMMIMPMSQDKSAGLSERVRQGLSFSKLPKEACRNITVTHEPSRFLRREVLTERLVANSDLTICLTRDVPDYDSKLYKSAENKIIYVNPDQLVDSRQVSDFAEQMKNSIVNQGVTSNPVALYITTEGSELNRGNLAGDLAMTFLALNELGISAGSLVTAGSTVFDKEVIDYANEHNIPISVHADRDWSFVNDNGEIVKDEQAFKSNLSSAFEQQVSATKQDLSSVQQEAQKAAQQQAEIVRNTQQQIARQEAAKSQEMAKNRVRNEQQKRSQGKGKNKGHKSQSNKHKGRTRSN